MRALPFVRLLLAKLGIMITASDLAVGAGHNAIGDEKLNDPKQQQALDKVVAELIALTRSLKSA
jgi:hypothetical protein